MLLRMLLPVQIVRINRERFAIVLLLERAEEVIYLMLSFSELFGVVFQSYLAYYRQPP